MKTSAKFLTCLLALALTACGVQAQPETQESTRSKPVSSAQNETTAAQETAELTPILMAYGCTMQDGVAYIPMDVGDSGKYFATTVDPITGQQQVLCGKSGCAHVDDTCPAYMTEIKQNLVPTTILIPAGDTLYWIADERGDERNNTYVDISDLNGANRCRIAQGDAVPEFEDTLGGWYTDGSSLYYADNNKSLYTAANVPVTNVVDGYKINRDGISSFLHEELAAQESCWPAGCWQDKILMQKYGGYEEPTLVREEGGDPQEELKAYLAADEAAAKEQTCSLWAVDTAGNLTDLGLHWKAEDGTVKLVQNDTAYLLREDGVVTKLNLLTGGTETTDLELPGKVSCLIPEALHGWLRAEIDGVGECRLNPDTGEYRTMPVSWFKDQSVPRSPVVITADDSTVLLMYNEQPYTEKNTLPNGVVDTVNHCRGEYGLILFEDYLAGSQEWTPITLLGKDIV